MKHPQVSIIIPVYNEKESLPELVNQITEAFGENGRTYEYIFIDDGSTDGTFAELKNVQKKLGDTCTVVRFRKNMGKSPAMAAGFEYAKGDIFVTMDADLQDDPFEVEKLLASLDNGYDLVVGWRSNRQDMKGKIRLSHFFNKIVAWWGGIQLHDMNCGLKAFTREVTESLHLYGELHRFIPILAHKSGFKVSEVQIAHHARKFGSSKFGSGRIMHAAFDFITTIFITTFNTRPLQIFGPIGLFSGAIGILLLLYLSYLHFLGESIGSRPLLFLGILFVLFGVQTFSTGLLGELITSLHSDKQKYPISEVLHN